ncbi:MAG: hypothetical protein MUF64_16175 [Polyangiaceae bacterium]|nr:hypothetical protein [Polyangiaceae bacterium]
MADWSRDPVRLERAVQQAIVQGFEPRELLPMVERLGRLAPEGSPAWALAHCKMAELLVETQPWRAAASARLVAHHLPEHDQARGLLGLALTVLGHYRSAARAYRAALRLSPQNPWYAHNLGHLLDAALGQPQEGLRWLRQAHEQDDHVEIAASLAQVLGRMGRAEEGLRVLRRGLRGEPPSAAHQELEAWLLARAPRPEGTTP